MKKYIPVAIIVPLFIGLAGFAIAQNQADNTRPYVKTNTPEQTSTIQPAPQVQQAQVKTTQSTPAGTTSYTLSIPPTPKVDMESLNNIKPNYDDSAYREKVDALVKSTESHKNCRPIVYGSSSYICD